MSTMTFLELKTAILAHYDLATPAASGTWITTAQINAMANMSLRRFYALMIECCGDGYYDTDTDITTSNGVSLTSFPERMRALRSLVWLRGTDDEIVLRPAGPEHEYLIGREATDWNTWEPVFKLSGTAFQWLPTPNAAHTIRCRHSALPAALSADGDFFEAGAGWEAFVIYDVCAMLAAREEKSAGDWVGMREEARRGILDQAPLRGDTTQSLFVDVSRSARQLSDQQLRDMLTRGDV